MRIEQLRLAVFQVLLQRADDWIKIGSCFRIPAWESDGRENTFFVTAYHVIREAISCGEALQLQGTNGGRVSISCVGEDADADIAILSSSASSITKGYPLPCASDLDGGPVAIFGYPAAFTRQDQTRAEWRGTVSHPSKNNIAISLYSEEIAQSVSIGSSRITPFDIWRGLSGGPCVLLSSEPNEISYALGITTSISPEGVAGRVYCTPIKFVEKLCNQLGLQFDLIDPIQHPQELFTDTLGEVLTGLTVPEREQYAWNTVSNLFFRDRGILQHLNSVIYAPVNYGLTVEDVPFVQYFVARLLLKKGNTNSANRFLSSAIQSSKHIGSVPKKRLEALVTARRIAEEKLGGPWQTRFERFQRARDGLESLNDARDSYKYLEVASFVGWECMKLFLSYPALPPTAKRKIIMLSDDHKEMLGKLEYNRPNQEVVSTALQMMSYLWSSAPQPIILDSIIKKAFRQAKVRRNSIFFIQTMLVRAIKCWQEKDLKQAWPLFLTVGELVKSSRLSLSHEGITQLSLFVRRCIPIGARLLELPFQWGIETTSHDKLDGLLRVGLRRRAAVEVLSRETQWSNNTKEYRYPFEIELSVFD